MDNVARYRQHAANCLNIAQNSVDLAAKLALLDMAQVWFMLAEEAERNGGRLADPGVQEVSARPNDPARL
jgi:hypothetical protein